MSAAPLLEGDRVPSLLDQLLAEQRAISAVDVFARRHDEALSAAARVYEERIPVGRTPLPGQQLAFRVDLDACTGCKACVTACHSLNGLAPEETWRDVGLLLGVGEDAGIQQTVTTACHHCEDPACLAGCPVRAYEKDPVTGIVRHLDDQCIGCQYCVLKCPYEVPKYNAQLGIVRKCDMCCDRLAVGEAPACVQGCPNGAISIEIVDAVGPGGARELLPAAAHAIPDSAYTRPTTRYVSARDRGRLRPANEGAIAPADPHHPLSIMLVLTQLGVGAIAFEAARALISRAGASPVGVAIGLTATLLGLGVANLHLGRPQYAFRVLLGLRRSWMSREIAALGAFAAAASAFAACVLLPLAAPDLAARLPLAALQPWLGAGAAATGALSVFCSVMIYADTPRPLWRFAHTAPLFALTCVGLGLSAGGTATLAARGGVALALALALTRAVVSAIKLRFESLLSAHLADAEWTPLRKSALIVAGPLRNVARARAQLGWLCGVALPTSAAVVYAMAGAGTLATAIAVVALAGSTVAEWLERQLFFRACAARAMPGI